MSDQQIRPEQFVGALGKLMEMACASFYICRETGVEAECYQTRRSKQIKLGEKPLEKVPLAIEIATLRQLEHRLKITRAMLENVEGRDGQLDGVK